MNRDDVCVHLSAVQTLKRKHVCVSVTLCLLRLNRLQEVTVADSEQLLHITQLDLRDTGLQELDVTCLTRLELLRCDRNSLSILRVSGHALKSLHAAHNGTDALELFQEHDGVNEKASHAAAFVPSELRRLEIQPAPENLTFLDLCRYESLDKDPLLLLIYFKSVSSVLLIMIMVLLLGHSYCRVAVVN